MHYFLIKILLGYLNYTTMDGEKSMAVVKPDNASLNKIEEGNAIDHPGSTKGTIVDYLRKRYKEYWANRGQ